jgi:hypothetical protein
MSKKMRRARKRSVPTENLSKISNGRIYGESGAYNSIFIGAGE